MSEERRYGGDEIEEIFERATEESSKSARPLPDERGLTLEELREIGREVGLDPELVTRAAADLDRPDPVQRSWGLPLSVSRTVSLPREPTDEEWETIVSDLRATFRAAGTVRRDGGLRGWTNGNLHAFVEPTGSGYRLRMGTTKGSSRQLLMGGAGLLVLSLVMALLAALGDSGSLDSAGTLLAVGAGMIGWGALKLPAWARERRRQMDELGERTRARLTEEDDVSS